jgi:ribonuclease HI
MIPKMLPKVMPQFINNTIQNSKPYVPEVEYKMQFDGCSKKNPGLSGAGAVIYKYDKEIWSGKLFISENATNNYAEYAGLILGLQKAIDLNIKNLHVEGDSLLVINQMTGKYKCNSQNLIEQCNKAKELATKFDNINFVHIFRNKNARADELSNNAVNEYITTNNITF